MGRTISISIDEETEKIIERILKDEKYQTRSGIFREGVKNYFKDKYAKKRKKDRIKAKRKVQIEEKQSFDWPDLDELQISKLKKLLS